MRNKNHIEPKVKTPDSNVDNDPEKLKESPRFGERLEYLLYISGLSRKDFCLKTALDTAHFYRMTKARPIPDTRSQRIAEVSEDFDQLDDNGERTDREYLRGAGSDGIDRTGVIRGGPAEKITGGNGRIDA